MKGIVFCGGRGIRLRPFTNYFQKVMIPIGTKQKPLLEYVIRLMEHHGVHDLVLMVGYKANQIANYFGDGARFGVNVQYCHDNPERNGTGGTILNAFESGYVTNDDTLVIYYGDILSNIDLSDLIRQHNNTNASATLALSEKFPLSVGIAEVTENGRITKFVEKPELKKSVSIGILVLKGRILNYFQKISLGLNEIDLMANLIPSAIEAGELVQAYITNAFWYDIGTTEKYEKLDNSFVDENLRYLLE